MANSYMNLGFVYGNQGDYPKALEYHEKCLAIRLKTFGAEHPRTKKSQELVDSFRNEIKRPI